MIGHCSQLKHQSGKQRNHKGANTITARRQYAHAGHTSLQPGTWHIESPAAQTPVVSEVSGVLLFAPVHIEDLRESTPNAAVCV